MGATSKLYVSRRFSLEDIKTVMENHLGLEVQRRKKKNVANKYYYEEFKIEVLSTTILGMVQFVFVYNKRRRTMTVFNDTDVAIKGMYELHLGYDEDAIIILETIAKVLGGLLEKTDFTGIIENIPGMLNENDGLPYFLKYAIIHNELEHQNDLIGLNESIHNWFDYVGQDAGSKMRLFPREKKLVNPKNV